MITSEFIAKIEGHGSLRVDWENNKVKLHVDEGERLFEGILVGRIAEEAHWITSRICGVCPIAHNLASLAAIENALGIEISETSKLLRGLMKCGQMIQSHVLHLFFLALPDYLGFDKGTDLAKKDKKSFLRALSLKEMADEIAHVSAGRNVHPTTTCIGGFHKVPLKNDLQKLLEKIRQTKENAEWAAKFFSELKYPELKVDLELVAQIGGKIVSNKGVSVPVEEYKQNMEEELHEFSTAKFGKFQGREVMVGALARLSFNKNNKYNINFNNPFHNNFVQAIEILEFAEKAEEIIEKLLVRPEGGPRDDFREPPSLGNGKGIGAIEAPRGGLYHEIHLDEKGIITYANIITPTVQNLTSIEKSANALLEQFKDRQTKEKEKLLNMLVRAYDPCITCSVH